MLNCLKSKRSKSSKAFIAAKKILFIAVSHISLTGQGELCPVKKIKSTVIDAIGRDI